MERFETVRLLSLGEKRPSDIASKLGLSRSEISRHLARLERAGLIEKSAKGYRASMMGQLAMQHCRALTFVIGQEDYFVNHMWEALPRSLLYRISALEDAEFLKGVTYTLRTLEKMISSSNGTSNFCPETSVR